MKSFPYSTTTFLRLVRFISLTDKLNSIRRQERIHKVISFGITVIPNDAKLGNYTSGSGGNESLSFQWFFLIHFSTNYIQFVNFKNLDWLQLWRMNSQKIHKNILGRQKIEAVVSEGYFLIFFLNRVATSTSKLKVFKHCFHENTFGWHNCIFEKL